MLHLDDKMTKCHQKHKTSERSVGSSYKGAALHANYHGPKEVATAKWRCQGGGNMVRWE